MATAEDAGMYVCRAQNGEGLAEGEVELVMEGGAFPQASVSETELTAVEGQSVSMHCQASGKHTITKTSIYTRGVQTPGGPMSCIV